MWEFTHEQTIDAPVEVVFRLMTDLPSYRNWNPFLVTCSGPVEIGGVVSGKSVLGKARTSYRHKIFEYVPNSSLCWHDFGLLSLLVYSRRSRYVEAREGKTHYKCHLRVSRPLSGLVNLMYGEGLRNGIRAEAEALNREAIKALQK
ncbi:MAG: SRPBCC domain-containing protein [Dehalococcoidia bacterium]|nr:SRPBCC domain-containing protein [Dehalococcoidia bacterium]